MPQPESRDYRSILKHHFAQRSQHNPRYSLRAFARDLALPPSRLSEALNGKTGLSRRRAEGIATRLGLSRREKELFCNSVVAAHGRGRAQKEMAQLKLEHESQRPEFKQVQIDAFHLISDWYHFAILELMKVKGFRSDLAWVARQLSLPEITVSLALDRLERLGMIDRTGAKWKLLDTDNATTTDVPSDAIRNFHRQILQKAIEALTLQNVEERDFGAMTMAIDPADLPRAKARLREFRRELSAELEKTTNKKQVYCLSTQLFRVGG